MIYGFNQTDIKRVGKAVKWVEKKTEGQQIIGRKHKKRSLASGDTYDGYFLATKTADTKVTISAGKYELNLFASGVAEEELTMSQTVVSEYIYLEGNISTGSLVMDLKTSTTFPESEVEIFKGLICQVDFTDNVISKITNQHYGIMRGVIIKDVS